MEAFHKLLIKILSDDKSFYKPNRTGIDSISRFGACQITMDLQKGFPALTTKKVPFKTVAHELIWFLRGDTNIRYLVDNKVPIWNGNAFQNYLKNQKLEKQFPQYSPKWHQEFKSYIQKVKTDDDFAKEHANLGEVYGAQWRRKENSIDQIAKAIQTLKDSPQSRRNIVTAWNPDEVDNMALPPCHSLYQLNVRGDFVDLKMYQRSADTFLGVPFNIASYAMLTQILADQIDKKPGELTITFGDAHIYCGADKRGEFHGNRLHEINSMVLKAVEDSRLSSIEKFIRENDPNSLGYAQTILELSQNLDGLNHQLFKPIKTWIEKYAPPETKGKELQDHIPQCLELLSREPRELPKLYIAKKPIEELTIEDFRLDDYNPHKRIKGSMAV